VPLFHRVVEPLEQPQRAGARFEEGGFERVAPERGGRAVQAEVAEGGVGDRGTGVPACATSHFTSASGRSGSAFSGSLRFPSSRQRKRARTRSASCSGVAGHDIYVSEDGGAWTLWQDNTAATSAIYNRMLGHTYSFYSVARDLAGNVQATPGGAQASTSTVPALEPRLEILPGSTPAHLFIEITARAGQVVTLQDSTDLAGWPDLETITLNSTTTTVEIQTPMPPPERFFRAKWTTTP
jgi:hypothetical protein